MESFWGLYRWLKERGLINEESNWYQYRFKDIVDPDTGRALFTIEHEVRSMMSPLHMRPLVNRNPAQRQPTYQRGRDPFEQGLELTIADDGRGFDPDRAPSGSTGLQIVARLTDQIGGSLQTRSGASGTAHQIEFAQ